MNLIIGKNSFISKYLFRYVKGHYISHKEINSINFKNYDNLILLSFNPEFKKIKFENFDFEKKIFSHFTSKKVFFFSTSKIYPYGTNLTEKQEPNPVNLYGENKLKIENILQDFTDNFFILRCSNIFKKDSYSDNSFLDILLKNYNNYNKVIFDMSLKTRVDFILVDRVCKILNELLINDNYGIYNISSGKGLSVEFIIEKILKKTIKELNVEILNSKLKNQTLSNYKIRKELNLQNNFIAETINEL